MYYDREDPPALDASVWRYMDLAKYLSLVRHSALHFSRRVQLEALDPWEGFLGHLLTDEEREFLEPWQRRPYVNCWHVAAVESAAMWEVYRGRGFGVAIRSTWGRLGASLNTREVPAVWGERVRYVDYAVDGPVWGNVYNPLFVKREAFAFEQEARLLVQSVSDDGPEALAVHVDLETLIEHVVVSPYEPEWVTNLIVEVTAEVLPAAPVTGSKLLQPPPPHGRQ
jgi:hypothetical protein